MEFSRNNSQKPKRIEWKDRWLIFNDFSHTLIFVIRKHNWNSDPTEQMSIDHEWSLRSPQDISSDWGKNTDPTKSPINLWPPLGPSGSLNYKYPDKELIQSIFCLINPLQSSLNTPWKTRNSYWIPSFWKGNLCHVGGEFSLPQRLVVQLKHQLGPDDVRQPHQAAILTSTLTQLLDGTHFNIFQPVSIATLDIDIWYI